MAVAAAFIVGQGDYKRMLAYSSVEHMGILAVGVGLGGLGTFAAMLHVINHSLTKAMLFMVAGNLLAVYRTKATREVSGAVRALPVSGVLWILGLLAIVGSPPFGPFVSEFLIAKAALDSGRAEIAIVYLLLLAIVVTGIAGPALSMAQGRSTAFPDAASRQSPIFSAVPAIFAAAILMMGIYLPPVIGRSLHEAARLFGRG
jgi:hydrogenase-4 component F